MSKEKIFRTLSIRAIAGVVIGLTAAFYMFGRPPREVRPVSSGATLTFSDVVIENKKIR